ncbi:TonB-dependent receptor domain-containing protein [Cellulophaga baltica]|uniref:TonB-dependent receptor domain-containing protein n=1 Tax=Cellulophaga baltica TaxID=76594 RepID=UPI0037CBB437
MKKAILCIALLINSALFANTEPSTTDAVLGTITGTILDQALQEPIAFAAIVIKSEDGSTIITGGITEENGTFEIKNIPEGTLTFLVQFIGYKTYSKLVTIDKNHRKIALGTIYLEDQTQELSGVEVVAERTTIEQKIDRKVINVGKDLTTTGASASDIMNNIPSVNIDQQTGELSMRGNSNVRVMVDGKLSNVPVAQLLKQIPSSAIKSIELITNPSAKYNPEGMSGIINIILHKNANNGFNGTISTGLTVGEEAKFNSAIDLNYRSGKFNVYGNYGNNIGKYVNNGNLYRLDDNSDQQFSFLNNNKSHLYKIGVDFYLNDYHTISFFTNQNSFDGKGKGDTDILYYDDASRNSNQIFDNFQDNLSEQYNFDYKVKFKKEGHSIELEVDYNEFNQNEDAFFKSSGATVFPNYVDMVDTKRKQSIANLDYVNPIDSISKLELGLESRNFETNVDYTSTGLSFNETGNLIPTPDTDFVYGMDIYSAYATFGQNYKKWSYQAGLRVENVEVKADTNNIRSFSDKYTQVYPSAYVTYAPNEKNQLQFSLSRRVDRPGLQQVNPIREWSTPLISSFGNQRLVPQFTNSYEFNYTKRLEKGSITTGVFYRQIKDEINRAVYVDRLDLNKLILTYDNFDNTTAYGMEVSLNYKPLTWWSINGSFDLFSQTQRGITETLPTENPNATVDDIVIEEVQVENTAWNFRMNNSLKATKNLSFQIFGFYRGANKNIQFDVKSMYFVNTGARYSFAEGKGTFSLNFNDVFNTMRFAFDSTRPYASTGEFNWESRTVYAGLSYMFGSGKNKASKRKNRDNNTKDSGGGIL